MWTVLQDLGKLNKKGMSAVEVVITFTLVAAISISLLNVVMTYKDREETESIKQEIVTYKNNITRLIQDDATKYIIRKVTKTNETTAAPCNNIIDEGLGTPEQTVNIISYKIEFSLTDEIKTLTVNRLENYISYTENNQEVKYKLPDLGTSSKERVGQFKCKNIPSFRISDVRMTEENGFFKVDINFYHNKTKLTNKYGIHIASPINFT